MSQVHNLLEPFQVCFLYPNGPSPRVHRVTQRNDYWSPESPNHFPSNITSLSDGGVTCIIVFSFMDEFSGYNQIQIRKEDWYKTSFTTPWVTLAYRVIPFGLKNVGATFQRAMTHCFYDLIHIMLVCLDNLIVWSQKKTQHIDDLWQVFLQCL